MSTLSKDKFFIVVWQDIKEVPFPVKSIFLLK